MICGVDEVGRGPWAGPVITCAVIHCDALETLGLRDSKKMTKRARMRAESEIKACAIYAYGAASCREIDQLNIRQATLLAMRRAIARLPVTPRHVDIDGRDIPEGLELSARAVVGGDDALLHIAAASILAKELRDRLMARLDQRYPDYGWANNAGYGTRAHQDGLLRAGITAHHRKSFKPIAKFCAPSSTL